MRQRLLVSALVVLATAVVAFALPLALAVRGMLVDRALDQLQGRLEQVALFVEERARTCAEAQLIVAAVGAEPTRLSLWLGGSLLATSAGRPTAVGEELAEATRGRMGRSYGDDRLAVATPLATGICGGGLLLRASEPADALERSIRTAWLGLGAVGLAVLGISAAAAVWQGRRLAEPFEELAEAARRLGEGDFSARAPRSGLPEADAIADALDATADRLGRAVQRATAFTADASHQLRTPLTALRLQLETIAAGATDDETLRLALEEADRLERTVDELVALTRVEGAEQDVDLAALVRERAGAWRAAAASQGRQVVLEILPCPLVRARPAAVGQALEVLVDNALVHGRGMVTVRVGPSLPDEERGGARVCVLDEGPGLDPRVLTRFGAQEQRADRGGGPLPLTGGRGLKLARSLVETEGGRLVIGSEDLGTRACIVLPGA